MQNLGGSNGGTVILIIDRQRNAITTRDRLDPPEVSQLGGREHTTIIVEMTIYSVGGLKTEQIVMIWG